MSYAYNLYQGSLEELGAKMKGRQGDDLLGQLHGTIEREWTLVEPVDIAHVLDWHHEIALIKEAESHSQELEDLVAALIDSSVVGVEHFDFGPSGSLYAVRLSRLMELLESAVCEWADALAADESSWDVPPSDRENGPLPHLSALLVGLRPADPTKDIILIK